MTSYYVAIDYDLDCTGKILAVVGTAQEEVLATAADKFPLTECIVAEPCTEILYQEVLERGAPRDYGYDEETGLLCTTHEAQEREMADAIVWKI